MTREENAPLKPSNDIFKKEACAAVSAQSCGHLDSNRRLMRQEIFITFTFTNFFGA